MKYLPAIAVFLLMVSTGMSLVRREFIANGRRLTPAMWMRLLLATFIVPPALVLALGRVLPISMAAMGGLYLIAVAPGFSTKVRRPLNVAGNLVLTVALIALLIKLWPTLKAVSPWVAIAALALAAGCLSTARVLIPSAPTLAISNANRHVGLALLLSGAHFQNTQRALPAIAGYALAAPLVMALYAKWMRCSRRQLT